jgi:hypothetical protein
VSSHRAHRPSTLAVVLLALLTLLASGCRLRLATDVVVEAEGSGELVLAAAADQELVDLLLEAGVDLRTGLADLAESAPEWEVEDVATDDGIELRFRTRFDEPSELGQLVDELHAGLEEQDGALLRDVVLEVAEDGTVRIGGEAGVRLPETAGVVGPDVGFDSDDLQQLLEERGDELVRADLRVTLPALPAEHDADEVDGRNLTWHLPVGEMRTFSAVSEVPPPDPTPLLAAGAFVLALALAAGTILLVRRRGRR